MTIPGPAAAELQPAERIAGFLIGAVVGGALAAATSQAADREAVLAHVDPDGVPRPLAPEPGVRPASTALADGLMEELVSGGVDLHRLTGRWLEWWKHDGHGADAPLRASLDHLRDFDAPIGPPATAGLAAMSAVLPAALASASPQGMIVGAFHVAGLLDPNETSALAAVSCVVAAARLLEGRRDFIPDVIAMLRANDAPADLLDGIRTIPRDPRTPPALPRSISDPVGAAIWILWTAYHRPRGHEALQSMALAGGIPASTGAVLGALMGARDGVGAWPAKWLDGAGEDVTLRRGLARRLASQ